MVGSLANNHTDGDEVSREPGFIEVDPRLKNKGGSTPLHLAVQNTGRGGSGSSQSRNLQKEIILLLQHGAQLEDRGARRKTVRQSIANSWILELLDRYCSP